MSQVDTPPKTRAAGRNDEIRKAIQEISKEANRRIAVSSAVIFLILIVIAFSLTDYLGFARGWTFFTKLVTGQSVTESTITADDIYNNLLPLFRDYDDLENQVDLAGNRIFSVNSYLALTDEFIQKSASANPTATDLYPSFIDSISSLRPSGVYVSNCNRTYSQFIVEDSYSYSGERIGSVPVTPMLRYCQFSEEDVTEATIEFPVAVLTLGESDSVRDVLFRSVANAGFRTGVDRLKGVLQREVGSLSAMQEAAMSSAAEAKDRISKAITQYVALNKVDVGQDVSFIVSRAFLLITLVSLAATSLKIILNEIRFSNRMNEVRIASGYALLHSDPTLVSNLYKTLTRDGEISKSDAEAGLSSRDVKELLSSALQSWKTDGKTTS